MRKFRCKQNIYYCFKKINGGYEKYIQAKTNHYYDSQGRLIKTLDYYRWKKDLELSVIRIYGYDKDKLLYEEVRQIKAGFVEKKYHIYNGKRKLKTIIIEFEDCKPNKVHKAIVTDYVYDRYGRLEKDIICFEPRHYSETQYSYQGAKRKPIKKTEYLQLGKGNRWWTTCYYDEKGFLKKEVRSYKKGPMTGKSFIKYHYCGSQMTCITSDGEKTVEIFHRKMYSTKWYDSTGALTRYTVMKEKNGMNIVWSWEYTCDCNGVVEHPVFQSVTRWKYN